MNGNRYVTQHYLNILYNKNVFKLYKNNQEKTIAFIR